MSLLWSTDPATSGIVGVMGIYRQQRIGSCSSPIFPPSLALVSASLQRGAMKAACAVMLAVYLLQTGMLVFRKCNAACAENQDTT